MRIENALDGLAAHNVNSIWLINLPVSETADFARRAATHGISVVAASKETGVEYAQVRNGDHRAIISKALNDWGDAPKPLAWVLGDEPTSSYMSEMSGLCERLAYLRAWGTCDSCSYDPDVVSASSAGFDALACDMYPFGSAGTQW